MFCSKCGAQNDNDSAFCQECGVALSAVEPSVSTSKGSKKKVISIIVGLVIVASIGAAAYFLAGGLMGKSSGLFPVQQNGKVGFMDKNGKMVINPQFDYAGSFAEGLALIKINNAYGFIDKNGKMVINPQYDLAYSFSDGLAGINVEGLWGFIDKNSKIVINPQFGGEGGQFAEGMASIEIGGKYGYIDKNGKMVISPQFDYAGSFSEDMAIVKNGNKYGHIDKNGKIVIDPQFDYAESFKEDMASVKINNKWGYIDKNGKMVINTQFDYAGSFSEGLATVGIGNKQGYIDKSGKIVISPQFDLAWEFSEGMASVKIGNKKGYIDKNGTIIINPKFDRTHSFGEVIKGLAYVEIAGKGSLIDKTGKFIEPNEKEKAESTGFLSSMLNLFKKGGGRVAAVTDTKSGLQQSKRGFLHTEITPEGMISKYFEAYIQKDFAAIVTGTESMFSEVKHKANSVPKSMAEDEWKRLIQEKVASLNSIENIKLSEGTYLENLLNITLRGGGSLFHILYPEMQYRIIEVREESDFIVCEHCSDMAFVEVTYKSSNLAPRLNNGREASLRVKKAIIKLYLMRYIDTKTQDIVGYTINNYVPTDMKRELF